MEGLPQNTTDGFAASTWNLKFVTKANVCCKTICGNLQQTLDFITRWRCFRCCWCRNVSTGWRGKGFWWISIVNWIEVCHKIPLMLLWRAHEIQSLPQNTTDGFAANFYLITWWRSFRHCWCRNVSTGWREWRLRWWWMPLPMTGCSNHTHWWSWERIRGWRRRSLGRCWKNV